MFKVLIAPDSFKGSLSSVEAADAMARGVRKAVSEAVVQQVPMADGGEGTVEALVAAAGGVIHKSTVMGPLCEPASSYYGILQDGRTAVIEMAAASGLPMVPADRRNPLATTTFGTGELIRHALDAGCRKLIIGLGGSATNDGGIGMAQALGARFLDADGKPLGLGGQELERIASIDLSGLDPRIAESELVAMCDVRNPLCGSNGAAAVYGPQKGADKPMIERLDRGLAHFAAVLKEQLSVDVLDLPGAGAAGGLGAGLVGLLGGRLQSGIDTVLEAADFHRKIEGADLILTGEGRTDSQTANGKVPAGIASAAQSRGVPVVCLSGGLGDGTEELYAYGITAFFSIIDSPLSLEEAMRPSTAQQLLSRAAENATRLFTNGIRLRKE